MGKLQNFTQGGEVAERYSQPSKKLEKFEGIQEMADLKIGRKFYRNHIIKFIHNFYDLL